MMLGNKGNNTYYTSLNNTVKTVENLKINAKLKKLQLKVVKKAQLREFPLCVRVMGINIYASILYYLI